MKTCENTDKHRKTSGKYPKNASKKLNISHLLQPNWLHNILLASMYRYGKISCVKVMYRDVILLILLCSYAVYRSRKYENMEHMKQSCKSEITEMNLFCCILRENYVSLEKVSFMRRKYE